MTGTADPSAKQIEEARGTALTLLAGRAPDQTVCPSEVARALAKASSPGPGPESWRSAMPAVHAAVDALVAEGRIELSWKKQPLAKRVGPYRIGRGIITVGRRARSDPDGEQGLK